MSLLKPKFVTKFFDPPPRFAGGMILNIFGYHVVRILFFQLLYFLNNRRPLKDERGRNTLNEILFEGISVIPNFFPDDIFRMIKDECNKLDLPVVNERAPCIIRANVVGEKIKTVAPLLEKYLAKNEFINDIVATAMRQELISVPTVAVDKSWFSEEDLNKDSTDKADNLHFDVSYPTMKCFMYLNKVDEKNAAFRFVRKSHKMTLARIWKEYKMSVYFSFWSKEEKMRITPEVNLSWVLKHGMTLESIDGEPNTLIIANTMGLHRRGDFSSTNPREMIFVNYRELAMSSVIKKKIKSLIKY